MNSQLNQTVTKSQEGFMLISVIVLMALSLLMATGMVNTKATEAKIRVAGNEQTRNYQDVEDTMSKTVAWLQTNSNNIVGAFLSSNFTSNFDITAPSAGTNESSYFSVPTLVKMHGTTNSVMLSNNALFGTSAFPTTTNIVTGAAFNATTAFAAANLGNANTRIVLVWAKSTAGHYQPIFRVDTITGNSPDRGVHSFTFIYSTLATSAGGAAFYSATSPFVTNTGNNQCYSHAWTYSSGAWSSGAQRSNCVLASNTNISVGANVGGSVLARGAVTGSGSVSGTVCKNSVACHSLSLPTFDSWTTACGSAPIRDLSIGSNTTLSSPGNLPSQNCWRDVNIASNRTLTLNSTTFPYRFRNITFQNQSNARLAFANAASGSYYTVYVENFGGQHINGNKMFNTNNAPNQLRLNITGAGAYTMNGTAVIRADIKAPLATFNLLGNFNFYGGIQAVGITMTGNARIYADEALSSGSPTITGISFAQTKASQRYRLF